MSRTQRFKVRTMIESFLLRELRTLHRELDLYGDEALIWELPEGLPNSGGTLTLHVCGNLQHMVGALLGRTGYIRDRDFEFSARDLPLRRLHSEIVAAESAVSSTLARFEDTDLRVPFPVPIRGAQLDTGEALMQLAVHLSYHLGQISYHRRVVTGDPLGTGALDSNELSTARPMRALA